MNDAMMMRGRASFKAKFSQRGLSKVPLSVKVNSGGNFECWVVVRFALHTAESFQINN